MNPWGYTGDETLRILEENGEEIACRGDLGISEIKRRIERARMYDPLIARVSDTVRYYERSEGVTVPKEDQFAMLAYYALIRAMKAERNLLSLKLNTFEKIVLPNV